MTDPAPRPALSRRQWLIRVGGIFALLAAGAIIAGVLVSKEQEEKKDSRNPTRPNTFNTMSDESKTPVTAVNQPMVDPSYPYQNLPDPKAVPIKSNVVPVDKAQTVDDLGPNATFFGTLYARGWYAVGEASNVAVCYPSNGKEVVEMVTGPACTIVVLTRAYFNPYTIRQTMNVTTRKIVVGNPITPPRLQAAKGVARYFNVMPGGSLDLQAFVIERPDRIPVGPGGLLRLNLGGAVMVYPGGRLYTLGMTFKLPDQQLGMLFRETIPNFVNGLSSLTFGGYILHFGGIYRTDGSWYFSVRPLGNSHLRSVNMGGNIAMIGGMVLLNGCWMVGGNAYRSEAAVGSTLFVLFGASIWSGGGIISANGLTAQYGAGMMVFVAGGVQVDNGFQYLSCNGAIHRAGYTQWATFGGVHSRTGYVQCRGWGVGTNMIYGQTYSVAGGILHYIGGVISSTANAFSFQGVGNTVAMNQGDFLWVGFAQGRATMVQSQFGLGFVYAAGGGNVKVIACPEATTNLVRGQFGLGAVIYQGTGFVFVLNVTRFSNQLMSTFMGQGNNIYLGAGGLVSVLTNMQSLRLAEYRTTQFAYTVGTNGLLGPSAPIQGGAGAYRSNFFFTNAGPALRFTPNFPARRKIQNEEGEMVTQEMAEMVDPATIVDENDSMETALSKVTGAPYDETTGPLAGPGMPSSVLLVGNTVNDYTLDIPPADTPAPAEPSISLGPIADANMMIRGYPNPIAELFKVQEMLGGGSTAKLDTTYSNGVLTSTDSTACVLANSESSGSTEVPVGYGECQQVQYPSTASDPMAALQELVDQPNVNVDQAMPFGVRALAGQHDLPDTFLHRGEFTLFCKYNDNSKDSNAITSGCATNQEVTQAVKDFFQMPQLPVAIGCENVPNRLIEMWKEFADFDWELFRTPDTTSEVADCFGYTRCTIGVSVQDQAISDQVEQGLKNITSDAGAKASFLQHLNAAAAGSDKTACDFAYTSNGKLQLPALNTPEWKPVMGGGASIGPKIDVVAPGGRSQTDNVKVGETYTVYFTNFPTKTQVNVKLISGVAATGDVVMTVTGFEDQKMSSVTWTPEGPCPADGSRQYLYGYATDSPALFAFSLPFTCTQ